ncbi:MFS transporter [Paenibacillus sp. MBLB4367]|uniref:MFS transporter n=1 Tax=Paenibacillus sp. MBLB4367 TaxID=3384767 RepID=UPI0039082118
MTTSAAIAAGSAPDTNKTAYRILLAISLVHLFNDSMQSVITAIFPILKDSMSLTYSQIGLISFALSFTASLMQPVVGMFTDARPSPYLLPIGMASTLVGMLCLGFAPNYWFVLLAAMMVGLGSSVFHPEGSRVSYMAAGNRRGLAQSIFQVGGNVGQALAPLMVIYIFFPLGQKGALWFTFVAGAAILVQIFIARWYKERLLVMPKRTRNGAARSNGGVRRKQIGYAIVVLIVLVFVRSWYGASISNYFMFYLNENLGVSKQNAQYFILAFGLMGAVSTFLGGPMADRFGRRNVIFFSMLGSAPFALILPYAGPTLAFVLLLAIGFILLSSFSVTVVYAQELIPGKIGTVSGLITGLAFGLGAVGALALGHLIELTSLAFVMQACAFLPLIGILTILLPSDRKLREWSN